MKNSLKRVLSVLLAAAMLLGMSVTTFAAGSPDTGESQPILRGPAKPITSVTLEKEKWNETEKCYEFVIREQGIGPATVKFGNTKLVATSEPLYEGANRTEVVGWLLHYKTPRIYSAGTYTLDATFVSTNGGGPQRVWNLTKDYTVTWEMLQK